MRIVFMGSPEFSVLPLKYLVLSQYQVVAVYTQPDRPAGRGQVLRPSPVKMVAAEWKLTVMQPASLRQGEVVAGLAGLKPDVIVVAAFGQLLPRSVLAIPRYGCLNIHPSLLPRFRGASPVASAILSGEEFTGVSIMLMDEGLDSGPVLARAQVPILAADTTGPLSGKLSRIGAQLLLEVLPRWLKGEITPQPQDEASASYCRPISKEAGEIDWRLPVVDIWRQVRAYNPWPSSYSRWRGRRLKIIEAVPLPGVKEGEAGEVVPLAQVGAGAALAFGVSTGEGVLGVLKVQLEGKRVTSGASFLRGQPGFVGEWLGLS